MRYCGLIRVTQVASIIARTYEWWTAATGREGGGALRGTAYEASGELGFGTASLIPSLAWHLVPETRWLASAVPFRSPSLSLGCVGPHREEVFRIMTTLERPVEAMVAHPLEVVALRAIRPDGCAAPSRQNLH